MTRDTSRVSRKVYDVAVIGGGIYGASVARDAALRGLTVALVDQGDFGHATSGNTHKIIHGGLRYLQHGDLKRTRASIRERTIMLRIAPHLVYPAPFLIPTYGHLLPGKWTLTFALKLNDLIGFDRNRGLDPQRAIPASRMISRAECLRLCPGLNHRSLTGGALFFDGQVYNTDRLILAILHSAAEAGTDLINYAKVVGFLRCGGRIAGIQVCDLMAGSSLEIRARIVVNCSGPWIDSLLELSGASMPMERTRYLKALVLVTRAIVDGVAVGIPGGSQYSDRDAILDKGHRYLFITPWRNRSLIGTFQAPFTGDPDKFEVTEQDTQNFLDEINSVYPSAGLKREDVYFVYGGLLPRAGIGNGDAEDGQYAKHHRIYDHGKENGISGLVSVMGVKYTTARFVAERTVDLVLRKLGKKYVKCRTDITPVHGGAIGYFEEFMSRETENRPRWMSAEILGHLIHTYGSEYRELLKYGEENSDWAEPLTQRSPVIKAEVIHAVRQEMAQKLSDVIFRRTEVGIVGTPDDGALWRCARIMAAELGWDERRTRAELEETIAVYGKRGSTPWAAPNADSAFLS